MTSWRDVQHHAIARDTAESDIARPSGADDRRVIGAADRQSSIVVARQNVEADRHGTGVS